ncbi:hypothetical protein SDC9_92563 [bioreactor metagenome]|uniref:Uncharacterized protein n=1 Tax=bioreactor metagenome TaxID=1076179 RepID=A0A645A0X0_9ZZZZ
MCGEILGCRTEWEFDDGKTVFLDALQRLFPHGSLLDDQRVIQVIHGSLEIFFQIPEIHYHSVQLSGCGQFFRLHLDLDPPPVAMDVCAFACIASKKMSAVEAVFCF